MCIVIALGLWCFYELLISARGVNKFAVWCGGATLMALAIAIGEIFHAGSVQRKIASSTSRSTLEVVRHASAAHLIESISLLDDAMNFVLKSDFHEALRSLQVARRFWVKVSRRVITSQETNTVSELFTTAERRVAAGVFTSVASPFTPQQRLEVCSIILKIKEAIERIERSGEKDHAAT
ncbi:hypothetical protein [Xanthomonas campestris]|nr:hypothetical protein [Xanthomonas campestris]UYP76586.1 hypothetical protein OF401_13660 [Xanthomonas campestris pv. campestris]